MILTGKVSIFQRIKNWFIRLRLRRRGIDLDELKLNIQIVKYMDKNPRSTFSLNPKELVMPELDLTKCPDFSDYFIEVENENPKK